MTILVAAALTDRAIVAADTRQRRADGTFHANTDKTWTVGSGLVAAHFGFSHPAITQFTPTFSSLWEERESVEAFLDGIWHLMRPAYLAVREAAIQAGFGDFGLTYIMASWTDLGAGVHWIDLKNDVAPHSAYYREGNNLRVVATGPGDAQMTALSRFSLEKVLPDGFRVDRAASSTIQSISREFPAEVGAEGTMRTTSAYGERLSVLGMILDEQDRTSRE